MTQTHTTKARIQIDGAELDIEPDSVAVEDNLDLPDVFSLMWVAAGDSLLDRVKIGSDVQIYAGSPGQDASELLIRGEIASIDLAIGAAGTNLVASGYDYSRRLNRERTSKTYNQVYDADIAADIARAANLQTGEIEKTPARYEVFSRVHQTDWEVLKRIAAESGMEVLVEEKKLHYRKPKKADEGSPANTEQIFPDDPLQLVMNGDLEEFAVRISMTEQYKEVEVRGWDPKQKKVLVGTAPAGTPSASLPNGANPEGLAATAGDKVKVIVDRTLSSQAEVDAKAAAEAQKVSGRFIDASGVARGNPKLKAGARVSISGVGRFDGKYTCTSVSHSIDRGGYRSFFMVSGSEDRSLFGLVNAPPQSGNSSNARGVTIGIVTNVRDPMDMGRIKVKFPMIPDQQNYESDWVRVMQLGASHNYGMVILPEVGDEVLVAFENGDPRLPIIIGSLYNGKDKPFLGDKFVDAASGKVNRRGFVSRKGHTMLFHDGDGNEGVSLATGDKGLRISLNKSQTKIKISSSGEVEITGDGDMTINAGGNLDMTVGGGFSISVGRDMSVSAGMAIKQEAGTSVDLTAGTNASLKAGAAAGISAPQVKLG